MTQGFLDDFTLFSRNGGSGPAWLAPIRRTAIDRFEALGFPTTRDEDWHYTSVAPIIEANFRSTSAPGGEVTAAQLAPFMFGASDWLTLVFVNGRYAPALSSGAFSCPCRIMGVGVTRSN